MNEKRAEGYYAEILHEYAGHLWCETTTKGFPVLVSEQNNEAEVSDVKWLPALLSVLVFYFVKISLWMMMLWMAVIFLESFETTRALLAYLTRSAWLIFLVGITFAVYVTLLNKFYKRVQGGKDGYGRVRSLLISLFIGILLVMFILCS